MTLEEAITKYAASMNVSYKEAKEDAQRLIDETMKELQCNRDFAEATFIEDVEDTDDKQIDEMTKSAKINKCGADAAKGIKKASTERKPRKQNTEKRMIIEKLRECSESSFENVSVINPERSIDFTIGNNHYTITITCHRNK